jgi:hypothetical protein
MCGSLLSAPPPSLTGRGTCFSGDLLKGCCAGGSSCSRYERILGLLRYRTGVFSFAEGGRSYSAGLASCEPVASSSRYCGIILDVDLRRGSFGGSFGVSSADIVKAILGWVRNRIHTRYHPKITPRNSVMYVRPKATRSAKRQKMLCGTTKDIFVFIASSSLSNREGMSLC